MAALDAARSRIETALDRLEGALTGVAKRQPLEGAAADHDALERDCEILRVECDQLRRRMAGVVAANAQLRDLAGEVEGQLGDAIARLVDLTAE